ncbi:Chorismate mutase [Methanonatronarchaeum thermophilum]|uniref:Chorismate mutase n=1 Tax=Methanonatronarchaeum thermophilum TaxID=1927129 RepID=A0A1Y3GA60_9EURY|nr:chorismate mutase [Methanonatronarchaeum thermophilum]OUJ18332.1 Chorismate mutase [Methanonatronarchaeum thermophilum]
MTLDEIRDEIREIDQEIIDLIDKRTALASDIAKIKKENDIPVRDMEQNKKVLSRATEMAVESGLDTGRVKKIFETLIEMNIEKQENLMGKGKLP